MKLNKILMLFFSGCAITIPIVLSSCSIKSSNSSTIDTNSKEIPVPFSGEEYDTLSGNSLYFSSDYENIVYEIEDINQWFNSEAINGRNYLWKTSSNAITDETNNKFWDVFYCANYVSSVPVSADALFNNLNDFYTWIKSSQLNYNFRFQNNPQSTSIYTFDNFNWNFLLYSNCEISLGIITHQYENTSIKKRYLSEIMISAKPKSGSQWKINRKSNNGNYNNTKWVIFTFNFYDPNFNPS